MVSSEESEGPKFVKHTIQLPIQLWTAFSRRCRRGGISKSEGLRRSVGLYILIADGIDDGSEIVLHRPNGKQERLVISLY